MTSVMYLDLSGDMVLEGRTRCLSAPFLAAVCVTEDIGRHGRKCRETGMSTKKYESPKIRLWWFYFTSNLKDLLRNANNSMTFNKYCHILLVQPATLYPIFNKI